MFDQTILGRLEPWFRTCGITFPGDVHEVIAVEHDQNHISTLNCVDRVDDVSRRASSLYGRRGKLTLHRVQRAPDAEAASLEHVGIYHRRFKSLWPINS